MEVHFTQEQEAQLAQIATKAGTDAERLVKDAVARLLEGDAGAGPAAPRSNAELPVWHLGGIGALHRRDIYDDALSLSPSTTLLPNFFNGTHRPSKPPAPSLLPSSTSSPSRSRRAPRTQINAKSH